MTNKIVTKYILLILYIFIGINIYAIELTGKITDASDGTPLPGANVYVPGTSTGTITSTDGTFELDIPESAKEITITYIGYIEKTIAISTDTDDLGVIKLESDAVGLAEVYVTASIAIDRETPIAVSNITPEQIEQKLGTQEFPEILKSTPGIYATKRGGGFGDADVRIRGFGSSNVAVLINGMPVNGMEDDKVYWSNWAGLADVTRTIQVQRGVGASKIAVPSVGGTINVITKTTDSKAGGNIFYTHGNDNYHKYGASVSSGLTENNLAATLMVSRTTGDGYVEGTPFEGYSYFLNISKKINDNQQIGLTVFGAPQEHAKRYTYLTIDDLETKNDGHRYNADWGYKNGEFYSNSTNFYHKPVAMLNHYWNIDNSTFLSSSIYASRGNGGGGYCNGSLSSYKVDGQIDWDQLVADQEAAAENGESASVYFQNAYNRHTWVGGLSSLKKQLGELTLLAGVDYRYYYGEHWVQADDLLGANTVKDTRNVDAVLLYNNEVTEGGTIYYDEDGEVMWEGLFVQGEYSNDFISAFASATVSNRSYRRYDWAQYFSDDFKEQLANDEDLQAEWEYKLTEYMEDHGYTSILESEAYLVDQVTDWQHFLGGSVKGGANIKVTRQHNIFFNGGYMERQPTFDAVFLNYKNLINEETVNEKILSFEVGYGFRSKYASANINAYYTRWNDKSTTGYIIDPDDKNSILVYNIQNVNARHMGLELDFVIKPMDKFEITGMGSLGDWIWANNVDSVKIYKDQVLVGTIDALYLKGIHVADAAQTTFALGLNYEVLNGLKIGMDANYYDRLYAQFELESCSQADNEGVDAERIPDYLLFDLNLYYKFKFWDHDASLYGNMNNVFNTIYIADAAEGDAEDGSTGYYYGYGRTWSVGIKIYF